MAQLAGIFEKFGRDIATGILKKESIRTLSRCIRTFDGNLADGLKLKKVGFFCSEAYNAFSSGIISVTDLVTVLEKTNKDEFIALIKRLRTEDVAKYKPMFAEIGWHV